MLAKLLQIEATASDVVKVTAKLERAGSRWGEVANQFSAFTIVAILVVGASAPGELTRSDRVETG